MHWWKAHKYVLLEYAPCNQVGLLESNMKLFLQLLGKQGICLLPDSKCFLTFKSHCDIFPDISSLAATT